MFLFSLMKKNKTNINMSETLKKIPSESSGLSSNRRHTNTSNISGHHSNRIHLENINKKSIIVSASFYFSLYIHRVL